MPEKEEWRDIEDYEGIYQVSNMGRVRRVSGGGHGARSGHILKPSRGSNEYLTIALHHNKQKTYPIHRLVCQAFHGHPPGSRYEVNHKNGKKDDNRAINLEWVTHGENMLHARRILGVKMGASLRGESHPRSQLTDEQVRQIRRSWETRHYTLAELGELFGVSRSHICKIIYRKRRTSI